MLFEQNQPEQPVSRHADVFVRPRLILENNDTYFVAICFQTCVIPITIRVDRACEACALGLAGYPVQCDVIGKNRRQPRNIRKTHTLMQ